jgi:hypothetical protein
MCDEERIAAKLKRNEGEDLVVNLKRDIEVFFAEKYATTACLFHQLLPQEGEMAKVDFTVSRESDFRRRYIGKAGYVDGHLTLGQVIRLM